MNDVVKCGSNSGVAVSEAVKQLKEMIDSQLTGVDDEKSKQEMEARIQSKLEAGEPLTNKELNYLKKYNPILYMHAMRIELKRKSVEERLKHARSKQEVQQICDEAIVSIGKNDPVKTYMIAAVYNTVKEFKETEDYKRLPEYDDERVKTRTNRIERDGDNEKSITYEMAEGSYQLAFCQEEGNKGFVAFS